MPLCAHDLSDLVIFTGNEGRTPPGCRHLLDPMLGELGVVELGLVDVVAVRLLALGMRGQLEAIVASKLIGGERVHLQHIAGGWGCKAVILYALY